MILSKLQQEIIAIYDNGMLAIRQSRSLGLIRDAYQDFIKGKRCCDCRRGVMGWGAPSGVVVTNDKREGAR